MGSAFVSGDASLSLMLGIAMILHKAPMAFGLSSYLISCKWNWKQAQGTLLVFSAMAPASTVVTLFLLQWIPWFAGQQAVSLAVLFSGGTFLYAATMHILPEVSSRGKMGRNEMIAIVAGAFLPVILGFGHHHH